jgi:hypothetical protein
MSSSVPSGATAAPWTSVRQRYGGANRRLAPISASGTPSFRAAPPIPVPAVHGGPSRSHTGRSSRFVPGNGRSLHSSQGGSRSLRSDAIAASSSVNASQPSSPSRLAGRFGRVGQQPPQLPPRPVSPRAARGRGRTRSARAASPWLGAGYRLGSDRGSPNHGSTLASKRVMPQIRPPARVRT